MFLSEYTVTSYHRLDAAHAWLFPAQRCCQVCAAIVQGHAWERAALTPLFFGFLILFGY